LIAETANQIGKHVPKDGIVVHHEDANRRAAFNPDPVTSLAALAGSAAPAGSSAREAP
jgi:hypothetical protein